MPVDHSFLLRRAEQRLAEQRVDPRELAVWTPSGWLPFGEATRLAQVPAPRARLTVFHGGPEGGAAA